MTASAPRTALVIGATGGFGGHVAAALIRRGWRLRALARNPEAARARFGAREPVEWIAGDAMNPDEVLAAAQGVCLIVHAANQPGYRNWAGTVLPMLRSSIEAAKAVGARLLYPGSVYNFAPDAGPSIDETVAFAPKTRKGRLRVQAEAELRAATQAGARVLVLRAGDFFGPNSVDGAALGWLTVRRQGRVTQVRRPGPGQNGHAFAYLPDLAEAAARLVEAEDRLAAYDVVHFRGHWLDGYDELPAAIRRATGQPGLPTVGFPYALLTALSPFNETFRELLEMRYLWQVPIGLNGSKLERLIGPEPHTPLDRAVAASLDDLAAAEREKMAA